MKNSTVSLRAKITACMGAVVLMMMTPAIAAPSLAIEGPATVSAGSDVTLSVVAAGFTDLYAYQFDVVFDPTGFAASTPIEGTFLSSGGATFFDGGTVDNVFGQVNFAFDTLVGVGPGVAGGGTLLTINFHETGGTGTSYLFGIENLTLLGSNLDSIDATVTALSVSAVPEPSPLLLAAGGLAILAKVGKRRQQRSRAAA